MFEGPGRARQSKIGRYAQQRDRRDRAALHGSVYFADVLYARSVRAGDSGHRLQIVP
jgi:hypothetical protein